MDGWFGLIELLLVFGVVLGWAFWELRKTRNYKPPVKTEASSPPSETRGDG